MKKTKIVPQTETIQPVGSFKLKFTNLRKTAYPTLPTRGDIMDFQVGDNVIRNNKSTVFEIVSITRNLISQSQVDWWERNNINEYLTRNNGNGGKVVYKSDEVQKFLEEYKKNGNFGAITFDIKSIVRNGKPVAKGKITKVFEMSLQNNIYRNHVIRKVDFLKEVQSLDYDILRYDSKIAALKTKRNNYANIKKIYEDLNTQKSINTLNQQLDTQMEQVKAVKKSLEEAFEVKFEYAGETQPF